MRPKYPWLLFVPIMIFLASCGEKADPYLVPDSSYGLIYTKIFSTSCALSGCHSEAQKRKDPAGTEPYLEGEVAYTSLINATPDNGQAAAAGLKLVVPTDPDNSFLYQKIIFDSSSHKFGAAMPGGGLTLTADQILFVRQWIVSGAPHDGHVADRSLID
jgi:hypothetical protein